MFSSTLLCLLHVISQCISMNMITIDPTIKIEYIFDGYYDKESITTFEYQKWGGHHALAEPNSIQSNVLKNVSAFANRWLKPDSSYFPDIPNIPNTDLPDLNWFNNETNQESVIQKFPIYIEQYGSDLAMIYCIEGDNWPNYMLRDNQKIPYNLSAGASIIVESLKVIQQRCGLLPGYFEPLNEPWTQKFGNVTYLDLANYQNYVNNEVYTSGIDIVIGGPAMDGVSWFKTNKNLTVFDEYFGTFISDAKTKYGYPLKFISWHQFSSFNNDSNVYNPGFHGSGCVSATMDLIESYTNKINGYQGPTKILISEHGFATETDSASNQFNETYMGYIGVNQYLTDTILYLERPESQYKIDAFYLTGNYAENARPPLVIVDPNTNELTLTGQMYYVNDILRKQAGNIVSVTNVVDGDLIDNVKPHAFYNNNTNKITIFMKEIIWKDADISVNIKGIDSNNIKAVDALSIYWDSNNGELIYENITLNLENTIHMKPGQSIVMYDIQYNNDYNIINHCRNRYYSSNFQYRPIQSIIEDSISIPSSKSNMFISGILRISLSWQTAYNLNNYSILTPNQVSFDGVIIDLILKRIDVLYQSISGTNWISFEYNVSNILASNTHDVKISFNDIQKSAFVTSIVAEIYTTC